MTQREREEGLGDDAGERTPGQIEQDIERTRERLTHHIDALGERLRPENLKREAKDAIAEKAHDVVAGVGDQARQTGTRVVDFISAHRLPSAAAGLGAILLFRVRARGLRAVGDLLAVAAGAVVMGLALGILLPEPELERGLAGETRDGFAGRTSRVASRVKEVAIEAGRDVKEAVRRPLSGRHG